MCCMCVFYFLFTFLLLLLFCSSWAKASETCSRHGNNLVYFFNILLNCTQNCLNPTNLHYSKTYTCTQANEQPNPVVSNEILICWSYLHNNSKNNVFIVCSLQHRRTFTKEIYTTSISTPCRFFTHSISFVLCFCSFKQIFNFPARFN